MQLERERLITGTGSIQEQDEDITRTDSYWIAVPPEFEKRNSTTRRETWAGSTYNKVQI